jgi:hypothetical protein
LNDRGAKYVVVGGFAIRAAVYIRSTMAIDVIVAADHENQARVFAALAAVPRRRSTPHGLARLRAATADCPSGNRTSWAAVYC